MSGGSTSSTTEQSQTSYPQWTQDAQSGTYSTGAGMLENFLRNPQYQVAGFTTDSLKGFDLARDSANKVFNSGSLSTPGAGDNLTPSMSTSASFNPASMTASTFNPSSMTAAQGNAAQVTGGEINSFMNPYLQGVLDPTIANMNRARNTTDAQIGAKYAAQGGLGGSGEALARGQLNRSFGEQVATTAAQLMAQGYDKAQATALANAQMRQQTDLANTGYLNDASKTNATLAQQANLANTGYLNDAAKTNASFGQQAGLTNSGYQQQTGLANQSAENAMRTLGLDYGLKSTQVDDQLRTSQQGRELSALQQILQGGAAQQGLAQQALDVPWTALQRLLGVTPKVTNSSTVGSKESENNASAADTFKGIAGGVSSLLGSTGGASGAGAAGLLGLLGGCDRSLKTDIEEIGIDQETGLMLYAFRYKTDPKHYPKVVAPMADEVEAKFPGSTVTIGGKILIRL